MSEGSKCNRKKKEQVGQGKETENAAGVGGAAISDSVSG